MNLIAMGIFVKEKDIALIIDQNELPGHKGSWDIEKNRCYSQRSYSCTASWKSAVASAAKAVLRQEKFNFTCKTTTVGL